MVEQVARELILPSMRLDVPPRPTGEQLEVLAGRSADVWGTTPHDWAHQQVLRLAVAAVLQSQLQQARPERLERLSLPADPEVATLAQLAPLFRPHTGLASQAFELAVIDAVNAGVPAVTEPVREGLRRLGITGREPIKMLALGLEKVPARARADFWKAAGTAPAVTAVIDRLSPPSRGADLATSRDVSKLDRAQLARADALVYGGGTMTPVSFTARPREGGRDPWLHIPVSITQRGHGQAPETAGRRPTGPPGPTVVEVGLRADGWVSIFDDALEAITSAMHQIDFGSRPRGRAAGVAESMAFRLAAAKQRTVADVCASLRAIDEFALEMFDHQVSTSAVPVSVPVLEDDPFIQLWLPTSATAGPLVTGAFDLFMGGGADYKLHGAAKTAASKRPGDPKRSGEPRRPADGRRAEGRPEGRSEGRPEGGRGSKRRPGRRGAKPGDAPVGETPVTEPSPAPEPSSTPPASPEPTPSPAPEPSPAPQPSPAPEPSPVPEPSPAPAPSAPPAQS